MRSHKYLLTDTAIFELLVVAGARNEFLRSGLGRGSAQMHLAYFLRFVAPLAAGKAGYSRLIFQKYQFTKYFLQNETCSTASGFPF